MARCQRPGCTEEAKHKYCSTACYRERKTHKGAAIEVVNPFEYVPREVRRYFEDRLGEKAKVVLANMNEILLENPDKKAALAPVSKGKSWGDWDIGIKYNGKDYRPREALDYDKINWMDEIGVVQFILQMKLAPALSVWRDENGWAIVSPDKELAQVLTAALKPIMPRFSMDFGPTSMRAGHAPFEQTYTRRSKYWLGLSRSKGATNEFWVPDLPRSINPEKLMYINRQGDGSFDGFTIAQSGHPKGLRLQRRESLIMTYQERYRNLYGHSFYLPMYPLAAMYEVAMRSMLRFLDRVSVPPVVGEGPYNMDVTVPVDGGKVTMTGMEAALLAASQVAYSNAVALPSDVDPQTNQPMFRLRYLEHNSSLDPFVKALEHIEQDMFRAGLAADRAYTQSSGGTGSYNIGEVHQSSSLTHSDIIMTEWVWGANTHWIRYTSEYNRGVDSPPVYLVVQMLDPRRRENFNKMIEAAKDKPIMEQVVNRVDWDTFLATNSIPRLSEEDQAKVEKKLEQIEEKKLEQAQKAMQQAADKKTESEAQKTQKKVNESASDNKDAQKYHQIGDLVLNQGRHLPLFLSEQEWQLLEPRIKEHDNGHS